MNSRPHKKVLVLRHWSSSYCSKVFWCPSGSVSLSVATWGTDDQHDVPDRNTRMAHSSITKTSLPVIEILVTDSASLLEPFSTP